jgi:pimeloyl-ACP methyl ester carboxylesterase
MLDETTNYSATDQLYKVDIPALFIWGKYDFVVAPVLGEDAYNKVSSTVKKFVLLEHSGHSGMSGEWKKVDDEIISFIDANR